MSQSMQQELCSFLFQAPTNGCSEDELQQFIDLDAGASFYIWVRNASIDPTSVDVREIENIRKNNVFYPFAQLFLMSYYAHQWNPTKAFGHSKKLLSFEMLSLFGQSTSNRNLRDDGTNSDQLSRRSTPLFG